MNIELTDEQKIDIAIDHFKNTTDEKLFQFLSGDDDVLKQIALLKLESINSEEQADLIVHTLVNHPSETREYCSFLINRLLKQDEYKKYFSSEKSYTNIERAVFDVNPKVCRKIIEVLPYFSQLEKLYPQMIKNSFDLIELLREKNKNKNYLYNKKSFHLYWHIFALGYTLTQDLFIENKAQLIALLNELLSFKEYTLREKGAYLTNELLKFDSSPKMQELLRNYTNDENFYVKEIFD